MGGPAGHMEDEPQGTVAPALDAGSGGLAEDGQVGAEPVGVGRERPAESVALPDDLLIVVEDPGDVATRGGQGRGEMKDDGDTAHHVDATAPPHHAPPLAGLQAARNVAGAARGRHGVEVPGDDDPLVAVQVGAGDDRVAVAQDL